MLARLAADAPVPELAAELSLFGRFVGAWDVSSTDFAPDGVEQPA